MFGQQAENQIIIAVAASVAAGLLCALLLYRKSGGGRLLNILLSTLRTLSTAIVVLLLFNPFIKTTETFVEQPTIVLLYDNSSSMALNSFSNDYKPMVDILRKGIPPGFKLDEYCFGETLSDYDSLSLSERTTDIGNALKSIEKQYTNRNIGSVVLVSDGINNFGESVGNTLSRFPFRVHTLLCGDTTDYADLSIKKIYFNRSVATNTVFKTTVAVTAHNCKGREAVIKVIENGNVIQQKSIGINAGNFSKNIDFEFSSGSEQGVRQLDFVIKGIENEQQKSNNSKRIFVDVFNRKSRILFYGQSPHPDLGAIASVLDDHYEKDFAFANDPLPDFSQYDLVVLHELPVREHNSKDLIRQVESNPKTSIWTFVGAGTDFEALNSLQAAIEVSEGATTSMFDAKSLYDNSFSLFTLNEKTKDEINRFPPLLSKHLQLTFNNDVHTLLSQSILKIETNNPSICFTKDNTRKVCFTFGTNIWRWRLFDYYSTNTHDSFNELIVKIIHYLTTDADDNLKILFNSDYYSDEPIRLNAELMNRSGERINGPDIVLTLTNKLNSKSFDYVFSRHEDAYELNIGVLEEGIYSFKAETLLTDKTYTSRGQFSVAEASAEAANLKADRQLMETIANSTNGQFFTIGQVNELIQTISTDNQTTPVRHSEINFTELLNYRFLLMILLVLLSAEWILRKIYKTY